MALFTLVRRGTGSGTAGGLAVLLYAASPQFYFLEAQFSHQAVATALLVALACLLVRSFDRGRPPRRGGATHAAPPRRPRSVGGHQHAAHAERSGGGRQPAHHAGLVGVGNTDALATSRRMSRPDIGLAMTPIVASATSRWRLTRQPLRAAHPLPCLLAAVARAVSGIRVSAAADKGHDRHLTRPA
jgi:hypothetical protein